MDGTQVVIVGGGFAGLAAARALRRAPVQVTLVDARNHHLFQPLLYQVATAGLNPADIAAPIRQVLRRQRNATVLLARVEAVDPAQRRLILGGGEVLAWDYLVMACGVHQSWFGQEQWAPLAPGLKTVEDALEVRRRVLFAFEAAERDPARAEEEGLLNFVVIGGGPTGVELAGALAELSRFTLAREFRRIDPRRARVILLERGPRLLAAMDPESSRRARAQLEALGVEVVTGDHAAALDAGGVTLASGARLRARTVLWAAGVAAPRWVAGLGAPLDRAGRVLVTPELQVPGRAEVYVAGDLAAARWGEGWVPGLAPAAIQMGKHAAANIMASLEGRAPRPFAYVDKGTMATVGRRAAVAELGGLRFGGLPAWLLWLGVHIVFLIGFRSRALVLFQWAWAYFTFQRGARLITERVDEPGS